MIDRIRKLATAVGTVLAEQRASEVSELGDSLQRSLSDIEQEMQRLRRIALENHEIIEEVIRQRDQMAEMYKRHGAEHAAAQGAMLDAILGLDKAIATRLLPELNAYRAKEGLPALSYDSPAERYRVIVGDYQKSLEGAADEQAKMPKDQLQRRASVDAAG